MTRWKRHPLRGRFCWWSGSTNWQGRSRGLTIYPNPQGKCCEPPQPYEWSVKYEGFGTLYGSARNVFAAMRESEMRAKRVKRYGYRPAMR